MPPFDGDETLDPAIRKQLKRASSLKKENAELKQRLDALEKKQTLQTAGIPQDARGDMFSKTYDGPNDPDSVRTAFEAVFGKVGSSPEGSPEGSTQTQGDAAASRIANAGAGTGTGGATGNVDFGDAMKQAWEEGGNAGLKRFIDANQDVRFEYDGRQVGIKLPDID